MSNQVTDTYRGSFHTGTLEPELSCGAPHSCGDYTHSSSIGTQLTEVYSVHTEVASYYGINYGNATEASLLHRTRLLRPTDIDTITAGRRHGGNFVSRSQERQLVRHPIRQQFRGTSYRTGHPPRTQETGAALLTLFTNQHFQHDD